MNLIFILSSLFHLSQSYAIFKQCDPKWGNDKVGLSFDIMCDKGNLPTTMAMILSPDYDPGTMNKWLTSNYGYQMPPGYTFIWDSVKPLGLNFEGF